MYTMPINLPKVLGKQLNFFTYLILLLCRDLLACLELSVDHMLDACSQTEVVTSTTKDDSRDTKDNVVDLEHLKSSSAVTHVVRRKLVPAIRDLMQHGLTVTGRSTHSLTPFMGCMSSRHVRSSPWSPKGSGPTLHHAWDVVLFYYHLRRGAEFNCAPQKSLSDSFGLDLTRSSKSNQASLLATVGHILHSHEPYKRSADAHFKAFICAGLK